MPNAKAEPRSSLICCILWRKRTWVAVGGSVESAGGSAEVAAVSAGEFCADPVGENTSGGAQEPDEGLLGGTDVFALPHLCEVELEEDVLRECYKSKPLLYFARMALFPFCCPHWLKPGCAVAAEGLCVVELEESAQGRSRGQPMETSIHRRQLKHRRHDEDGEGRQRRHAPRNETRHRRQRPMDPAH